VKNKKIYKGILAALILVSPLVNAKTDYPAANFQPKVLYSDSGYKHSGSTSSSTNGNSKKTKFDANYPAAAFEPKVVFKDTNYKHKKNIGATTRSNSNSTVASVEEESADSGQGNSDQIILVGLIVLAGLGFYFFRKKSPSVPRKRRTASRRPGTSYKSSEKGGVTGVAKYLEGKESKVTGVAKYLAGKQQTVATGVAKYMAKQVVAARKVAAENITGVEKYLRDKG